MRPRGVPSSRVKILPWYYTDKNQPSRQIERHRALAREFAAFTNEVTEWAARSLPLAMEAWRATETQASGTEPEPHDADSGGPEPVDLKQRGGTP